MFFLLLLSLPGSNNPPSLPLPLLIFPPLLPSSLTRECLNCQQLLSCLPVFWRYCPIAQQHSAAMPRPKGVCFLFPLNVCTMHTRKKTLAEMHQIHREVLSCRLTLCYIMLQRWNQERRLVFAPVVPDCLCEPIKDEKG